MKLASGTLPLILLLTTGCGFLPFGKHDSSNSPGPGPSPSPSAPIPGKAYLLDAGPLNPGGAELTYAGSPVTWTVRMALNGTEVGKVDKGTFAAFKDLLAKNPVKVLQEVELDVTLRGTDSGVDVLLATNLASDLAGHDAEKATWDKSCQNASKEFEVGMGQHAQPDDKGNIAVDLQVCDFRNVLVAPTLTIKPVNLTRDFRHVTYACSLEVQLLNNDIDTRSGADAICQAGYFTPSQGSIVDRDDLAGKAIEIPASAAGKFQLAYSNFNLIQNTGTSDPALKYKATLEIGTGDKLPVGSIKDCYTLEFELPYKDNADTAAGTSKTSRLSFDLAAAGDNYLTWSALDQSKQPTPAAVMQAAVTSARFYLHCTWENTTGVTVTTVQPTKT